MQRPGARRPRPLGRHHESNPFPAARRVRSPGGPRDCFPRSPRLAVRFVGGCWVIRQWDDADMSGLHDPSDS